MSLAPGTNLGPYELEASIGAGGMGQVYRARDTRLGRIVAVKVLAPSATEDATRRMRFEQEARLLASLNHPHVCALFDVGHEGSVTYLVMEMLEGETLAQRLARDAPTLVRQSRPSAPRTPPSSGPRTGTAMFLRYGAQIASALAAAHERGLVHRDLKPSNIMITQTGIKLLDFGLAKPFDLGHRPTGDSSGAEGLDKSPSLTGAGELVGTLAYMAPEQLEGAAIDPRTDVFALGAVLYEMLTGRRPFEGRSEAALIAAILSHEPVAVRELSPDVPPAFARIVEQCLAKSPADRWQSAADVKRALDALAADPTTEQTRPARPRRMPRYALVAGLLAANAALIWAGVSWWPRRAPAPPPPPVARRTEHLAIVIPRPLKTYNFALSPAGDLLAYSSDRGAGGQLYVRSLASAEVVDVPPRTEVWEGFFWSRDGKHLLFLSNGTLYAFTPGENRSTPVTRISSLLGGSVNRDGTVLFSVPGEGLFQVPLSGGEPTPVPIEGAPKRPTFSRPTFLRDGQRFLFVDVRQPTDRTFIRMGTLPGGRTQEIVQSQAGLSLTADGLLLYRKGEALGVQLLDEASATLKGAWRPVAPEVESRTRRGLLAAELSDHGHLLFVRPQKPLHRLRWYGRDGQAGEFVGDRAWYRNFDLSPDGRFIVYATEEMHNGTAALRTVDLVTGRSEEILRSLKEDVNHPVWTGDKRAVVYGRYGDLSVLARQDALGLASEDLESFDAGTVKAESLSRDGRWLAVSTQGGNATLLDLAENPHRRYEMRSMKLTDEPHISPDGHWVAYGGLAITNFEVFVEPVPPDGRKWQVSTGGGAQPRWRADGKELYFINFDGKLYATQVSGSGKEFRSEPPVPLFKTPSLQSPFFDTYAVAPAGDRFLFVEDVGDANLVIDAITGYKFASQP